MLGRLTLLAMSLLAASEAMALPICPAPPARRHDCIVDGDTWWIGRTKYRHATIDAPEISPSEAHCGREIAIGLLARDRLQTLLSGQFEVQPTGRVGAFGRPLATILLPDGREAGDVLMTEGLAVRYPEGHDWCQ
jgi:endonuclease YncB( thermonuclease family)